jgi:hypothetical protein
MGWLRAKARRLSLLALFALAMQFALSFGHTHVTAAPANTTIAASGTSSDAPDHHDADALCVICIATAMTANALSPAGPALPLPVSLATVTFVSFSLMEAPRARTAAFHPRGPPSLLT